MHDTFEKKLRLWRLFNPVNKEMKFIITRNRMEEKYLLNGPDKYTWQFMKIHLFCSKKEIMIFFKDMERYHEMFKKETNC